MPVRPASVDGLIENFLGKLFFVRFAQAYAKKVYLSVLDSAKVRLAPARSEKDASEQRVIFFQIVDVGGTVERDHFLIHLARYMGGHRKHRVYKLLVRQLSRATACNLRCGEICHAWLFRRIVSGAGEKDYSEVD